MLQLPDKYILYQIGQPALQMNDSTPPRLTQNQHPNRLHAFLHVDFDSMARKELGGCKGMRVGQYLCGDQSLLQKEGVEQPGLLNSGKPDVLRATL